MLLYVDIKLTDQAQVYRLRRALFISALRLGFFSGRYKCILQNRIIQCAGALLSQFLLSLWVHSNGFDTLERAFIVLFQYKIFILHYSCHAVLRQFKFYVERKHRMLLRLNLVNITFTQPAVESAQQTRGFVYFLSWHFYLIIDTFW